MNPSSSPAACFIAIALAAVIPMLGCSGSGFEAEPSKHDAPTQQADSAAPDQTAALGLGTPFVLQAHATDASLAQVSTELIELDGSRVPVSTRSISFELRSDGRVAAIDHVRVELALLASAEPVAISNRAATVLTVLDSSPDYVRATAGLAWSLEQALDQPRSAPDAVPVNVALEAEAQGTHVRLTMTLESRAEFPLGDVKVSTGPWVVQLEGELAPR